MGVAHRGQGSPRRRRRRRRHRAFDSIQLSEAGSFRAWAGEAGAQQRAAAEASAAAHAAADQSLGALVQDLLRRDIEELGMYIT